MAKWDLNPAIWSRNVLTRSLLSWWVVLVGCGAEGSVRAHSNFQAAWSSTLLAGVCCHLPH